MIIDLFEFTRQQEAASGRIGWENLSRVDTPARDGALAWSAQGSMQGRHGAARLDLEISGAATLICQRCLKPMQQPIAVATRFLVAADEDSADDLDRDDEYDVVVGSTAFDLDALIEDEVILALSGAPRHPVCPDGPDGGRNDATRPSPFASLAALKAVRPAGDAEDDE